MINLSKEIYWQWPENLDLYYSMVLGYHLTSVIELFTLRKTNDFYEMSAHHCATVFLLCFSWFCNLSNYGLLVAYLHDFCDIGAALVKFTIETTYSNLAGLLFVNLMALWFYMRIYVLMDIIYHIKVYGHPDYRNSLLFNFFSAFLTCLWILHAYWFCLFCKMLKKFVSTGDTTD